MIYKFDTNSHSYVKITNKVWLIGISIIMVLTTLLLCALRYNNNVGFISEETRAIILREYDKDNVFSREKLKAYILQLHIKFPHIVLAQSEIETGHFTSSVFKENHNLFGMFEAKQRPCAALGTNNNYAYYNDWKESVQDYAMFQAAYLKDIHTEEDYFEYLKQNYAENPQYVTNLKKIINKNN